MFSDEEILAENPSRLQKPVLQKIYPSMKVEDGLILKLAEDLPSSRLMKTHYSLTLFPKNILERVKVSDICHSSKVVLYI